MFKKIRPHERGLAQLMEGLAESTLSLSDEVLLTEACDQGEDPEVEAAAVRKLLHATGKFHRQALLRTAMFEYRRLTEQLSTRWVELPDRPEARRDLLAGIFARHPTMQDAFLTVQHREFRELSDADVESCLAQLLELGFFLADEPKGDA